MKVEPRAPMARSTPTRPKRAQTRKKDSLGAAGYSVREQAVVRGIKEQSMNLSETDVTTCDRCKGSAERAWYERWGGTRKRACGASSRSASIAKHPRDEGSGSLLA